MILYLPINRGICVNQWLILMPQRVRGQYAYVAHEQCHQEQMRKTGTWTFWWRYLTDQQFRINAEVEAYKVQIEFGETLDYCAYQLSIGYRDGMPLADAYKLLRN